MKMFLHAAAPTSIPGTGTCHSIIDPRPGPEMRRVPHVPRVSGCTDSGKTPESCAETRPRLVPVEIGRPAWRREWDSPAPRPEPTPSG